MTETTTTTEPAGDEYTMKMEDMVRLFKVHRVTVRRWVKRGMPAVKVPGGRDLYFGRASIKWHSEQSAMQVKVQP
jgi:hypothetical protein